MQQASPDLWGFPHIGIIQTGLYLVCIYILMEYSLNAEHLRVLQLGSWRFIFVFKDG